LRARRRTEAEWQVQIRERVGTLIAALVARARGGLTPAEEARWREAARNVVGSAASQLAFTNRGSYGTLFGMGGPKNVRKYVAVRGERTINEGHLVTIAQFLGSLFLEPVAEEIPDLGGWVDWLDEAVSVIHGKERRAQEAPPEVISSIQRSAARMVLQEKVIAGLQAEGRVAIVGMSGTGKTVLARQVLKRWSEPDNPAITIDARSVLANALASASPRAPDAATDRNILSGVIVREVAARLLSVRPRSYDLRWFKQEREALLDAYPRQKSERGWRLHRRDDELVEAIHSRDRWADFLNVVVEHVAGVHNADLLQRIATILRPAAVDLVVFVDDAFSFPTGGAVGALFAAEQGRDAPCLLVTSIEKDSLARLSRSCVIDLDDGADQDATEFARDIVTVWSASDSQVGDEAALAGHRREVFAGRTGAAIETVIRKVGRHPLAVAALAAAWRADHGFMAGFWSEAAHALDADPYETLVLRDDRGEFDERHRRVLKALRFAWSLFDPVTQERFLDLALMPPNQPIERAVCDAYWQRKVGDGRKRLAPAFARPLERLADKSLVQKLPNSTSFVLHSLHRWMIEAELGEAGVQERHRSFLRFCGLIDGTDRISIDLEDRFRALPGGETLIVPGEEISAEHQQPVGRYLVRHLMHHLRQLGRGEVYEENLQRTAANFSFLQARLAIPSSSGAAMAGNVEALVGAFDGIRKAPGVQLRRTLQMAGPHLAVDRRRLAAQICARVSPDLHPLQFKLCADARRSAPDHAFCARFPFLPNGERSLIATLPIAAGWKALALRLGRPTVLTTSQDKIGLWDVTTSEAVVAPMHHPSLRRAKWITAPAGTSLIVSWSEREIRVWNTIDEVLLAQYRLPEATTKRRRKRRTGLEIPYVLRKGGKPPDTDIGGVSISTGSDCKSRAIFWTLHQIFVWDYLSGSPPVVTYSGNARIARAELARHPVGDMLLIKCTKRTSASIMVWDVAAGKVGWSRCAVGAAWMEDDPKPFVLAWDHHDIHLCDALDGAAEHLLSTSDPVKTARAIYSYGDGHEAHWLRRPYLEGARLLGSVEDRTLVFWTKYETWRWSFAQNGLVVRRRPRHQRYRRGIPMPYTRFVIETAKGDDLEATIEPGFHAHAWRHGDGSLCEIEVGEEDSWIENAEVLDEGMGTPAVVTTHGLFQIWERAGLAVPKASNRFERQPTWISWISYRQKEALLLHHTTYDDCHRISVIDAQSGAVLAQPLTWPHLDDAEGGTGFRWIGDLPVGPRLLSVVQGTVELWNPETGQRSPDFAVRHQSPIIGIDRVVLRGGRVLGLSHSLKSIRLWTLPDMQPGAPDVLHFDADNDIRDARFVNAGRTPRILVRLNAEVRLCNLQQPTTDMRIAAESTIRHVHWIERAPKGCAILIVSSDTVTVWDAQSGRPLTKVIKALTGEDDRSRLLNAMWIEEPSGRGALLTWSTTRVRLWDGASGELRCELRAWRDRPPQTLMGILYRPDKDHLRVKCEHRSGENPAIIVICYDQIRRWDPWNDKVSEPFGHTSEITDATWIQDANGRLGVVSSAWDGSLRVWDGDSGQERKRFVSSPEPRSLARAPQGYAQPAVVAVDFGDGAVGVFDVDLR
jgi:WD40 repeat protein